MHLHLDRRPSVAAEIDDSRQEDAETVKHAVQAVLSRRDDPGLPVLEGIHGILLVHQLGRCRLADLSPSNDSETLALLFCQELGSVRAIRKDKWCNYSRNNRGNAVNEEDPSPASPAVGAVKEADCVRDESTKSSCPGRSREEIRHSQGD